ncbi:hypothetical protein Q5752_005627 [Cryptotrichosporon argae]
MPFHVFPTTASLALTGAAIDGLEACSDNAEYILLQAKDIAIALVKLPFTRFRLAAALDFQDDTCEPVQSLGALTPPRSQTVAQVDDYGVTSSRSHTRCHVLQRALNPALHALEYLRQRTRHGRPSVAATVSYHAALCFVAGTILHELGHAIRFALRPGSATPPSVRSRSHAVGNDDGKAVGEGGYALEEAIFGGPLDLRGEDLTGDFPTYTLVVTTTNGSYVVPPAIVETVVNAYDLDAVIPVRPRFDPAVSAPPGDVVHLGWSRSMRSGTAAVTTASTATNPHLTMYMPSVTPGRGRDADPHHCLH